MNPVSLLPHLVHKTATCILYDTTFFSLPMQLTHDQKCINFDEHTGDNKAKYKYRHKMNCKW